MIQLTPQQTAQLRHWFIPDRPGPMVGLHVIQTGHGACFVDRWPNPQVVLVDSAGNYSFLGDHEALEPADLKDRVFGFVEAPDNFVSLLKKTFPAAKRWNRIMLELPGKPNFSMPGSIQIHRLTPADTYLLWGLSPESAWITKTWGGPAGLTAGGRAWGAIVDGRLVSVACPFFVGDRYEDIGVITEPGYRGQGLSVACTGALCLDIQTRGRRPSWTTSPDNEPSLRVAQKLGFTVSRHDYLYVIGYAIPKSARPEKN